MNVLFLAIGSNIDINRQDIYTDLLKYMQEKGDNISFVFSYEKRLNKKTTLTNENGINCLGVKIGNVTKTNFIEKGISLITLEKQYLKQIKKHFKTTKFDLIIYTTPPITFEKVVKYIKKRDNAKSYLLLKDIFPQNAVDLGMFSNKGLIYNHFRRKEKKLYLNSDYIGCMSQANVDYVLKHNAYIKKEKVHINPNTLTPLDITTNVNKKELRNRYGIPEDKIIFLYGGNFGKPQGVDFLLECLLENEKRDNVFFALSGAGTEFSRIEEFFKVNKIKNSKLLSYIPREDYNNFCNVCDVGMIFLDSRFTIPNFPSRVLSYMQSELPIIAATDKNTDFGQVITKGGFGLWSESGDLNEFNTNVEKLVSSDIKVMGKVGRKYLEDNYHTKNAYEILKTYIK